jgi:hypothetical protein
MLQGMICDPPKLPLLVLLATKYLSRLSTGPSLRISSTLLRTCWISVPVALVVLVPSLRGILAGEVLRVIVIGERGKGDAELCRSNVINRANHWGQKYAPRLVKSK